MIPFEKPKAPGEIDEDDITEYFSTNRDICMYWDDVFQPCADLIEDWKDGIGRKDQTYDGSYVLTIISGAGHKMMYDFIVECQNRKKAENG